MDKFISEHPFFVKQDDLTVKCTFCDSTFLVPDSTHLKDHLKTDKHIALSTCSEADLQAHGKDNIVKMHRCLKRYDNFLTLTSSGLICRLCPNVCFNVNKPDQISAHRRKFHSHLPVFEKEHENRKSALTDKLDYASVVLSKYEEYYTWNEGNIYCKSCKVKIEPKLNYKNYTRLARDHLTTAHHVGCVEETLAASRPKSATRQDPFLTPPKKVPVGYHSREIEDSTVMSAANVMMYCKASINQADKTMRNTVVQECKQDISPSTIEKRGIPLLHQSKFTICHYYLK